MIPSTALSQVSAHQMINEKKKEHTQQRDDIDTLCVHPVYIHVMLEATAGPPSRRLGFS